MENKDFKAQLPYWKDLNLKMEHLKFIYYYCTNNFNNRKSYISAYNIGEVTDKKELLKIDIKACGLLKLDKIKEGIKRYLKENLGIKKDKLETELFNVYYARATYQTGEILNDDGSLRKPIVRLPKRLQYCIDGIERKYYGKSADTYSVIIKLANREVAMKELSKYIDMIKDKVVVEEIVNEDNIKKLQEKYQSRLRELGYIDDGK